MRESIGVLKTLFVFQNSACLTCRDVAAVWGGKSEKKARDYTLRYSEKGYLERVNPNKYPAVYKITPKGMQVIQDWLDGQSFEVRRRPRKKDKPFTGVRVNSVFALGDILNKS